MEKMPDFYERLSVVYNLYRVRFLIPLILGFKDMMGEPIGTSVAPKIVRVNVIWKKI